MLRRTFVFARAGKPRKEITRPKTTRIPLSHKPHQGGQQYFNHFLLQTANEQAAASSGGKIDQSGGSSRQHSINVALPQADFAANREATNDKVKETMAKWRSQEPFQSQRSFNELSMYEQFEHERKTAYNKGLKDKTFESAVPPAATAAANAAAGGATPGKTSSPGEVVEHNQKQLMNFASRTRDREQGSSSSSASAVAAAKKRVDTTVIKLRDGTVAEVPVEMANKADRRRMRKEFGAAAVEQQAIDKQLMLSKERILHEDEEFAEDAEEEDEGGDYGEGQRDPRLPENINSDTFFKQKFGYSLLKQNASDGGVLPVDARYEQLDMWAEMPVYNRGTYFLYLISRRRNNFAVIYDYDGRRMLPTYCKGNRGFKGTDKGYKYDGSIETGHAITTQYLTDALPRIREIETKAGRMKPGDSKRIPLVVRIMGFYNGRQGSIKAVTDRSDAYDVRTVEDITPFPLNGPKMKRAAHYKTKASRRGLS